MNGLPKMVLSGAKSPDPAGDGLTRRRFLQSGASLSTAAWLGSLPQLAHAANTDDYKALVCVFLMGGNDHHNTLVPYDATNYSLYQKARADVALPQDSLLPLLNDTPLPYGLRFGLNNTMQGMQTLFNQGQMAVLLNVGPLYAPTTLADYQGRAAWLPPKLFSHNDQQAIWQTGALEGHHNGWGGDLADEVYGRNTEAGFSCISLQGNSVFLAGDQTSGYGMGDDGVTRIQGSNAGKDWMFGGFEVSTVLTDLISTPSTHPMQQAYCAVTQKAIRAEKTLSAALAGEPELATAFDASNSLASQLKMVAKLIRIRQKLGMQRQVFFVALGGFDTHDGLLSTHGPLIGKVSSALASFYQATVELGVASQVTTFTASDFGRTLSCNGNGSDHGWGSHHFILGGAVKGKAFYGTAPQMGLGTPNDTGQGRLLPSTSVDQYAATLARWFGVPETQLGHVAPHLVNFTQKDLGFMV